MGEITEEVILRAILRRLNAGQYLFFEIGKWNKPSHAWFNGKPVSLERAHALHKENLIDWSHEHTAFIGAYKISAKGKRVLEELENALQDRAQVNDSNV